MSKAAAVLLAERPRRPEPPIDKLKKWPRYGMSISGLILNPRHNVPEVVRIYEDCGVQLTRLNYLATSWVNPANVMPFRQKSDGRWDLFDWREEYFDRAQWVSEELNAKNIVMQGTVLELYSISRRKSSEAFLAKSPWRFNVNGIAWGVPVGDQTPAKADAIMLAKTIPDEWVIAFLEKLLPRVRPEINPIEIGNEFPEKSLHERMRNEIRRIAPNAIVTFNRNEETPGQWANMKMSTGSYDMVAFHGRRLKTPDDLDRPYPESKSKMLPTATFRELLEAPEVDNKRIIFSSDGARSSDDPVSTYDWDNLREFFREVKQYGCNIEHQSRAKMSDEPNHHMIEADWFRSVIA